MVEPDATERRAMDGDGAVVPIDPDLQPGDRAGPSFVPTPVAPGRRSRAEPDLLAVMALGATLGASARYGVAQAVPTAAGHFPWATFWTNLTGSLLLGFLLVVIVEHLPSSRYVRPFVATGVLGAYTTMSTFLVETAVLIKDGHAETGLLYGIGSIVAGVALTYVGIIAARRLPRPTPPTPREQWEDCP